MSVVVRTTYIATERTVGMPRRPAELAIRQPANAPTLIEDGYHHQAITSLQAVALAVVASVLVTGLMWVAL